MMPSQAHMHFEVLLSAGLLLISIFGEPGVQGAGVTGIQGMGVSTPRAAVVAVATAGFARDAQRPKGAMFAMGI